MQEFCIVQLFLQPFLSTCILHYDWRYCKDLAQFHHFHSEQHFLILHGLHNQNTTFQNTK